MLRVGVDVDGIVANFFSAFEALVAEIEGIDRFPKRYPELLPPVWDYPQYFGYSAETVAEARRRIGSSQTFWAALEPLPLARRVLQFVDRSVDEAYFITDRFGVYPQTQTASWLVTHGHRGYPAVVINKHKGAVCRALSLTHYIDDKGSNILQVLEQSPSTQAYLLTYPYNIEDHAEIAAKGGHILTSVAEFVEALRRHREAHP